MSGEKEILCRWLPASGAVKCAEGKEKERE